MNELCESCGGLCCKGVSIDVSKWTEPQRVWALTRGVIVDDQWYIDAPCKHLGTDGKCLIYDSRPLNCLAYRVDGPTCRATRAALGDT